jgi:hypothetical protein
MNYQSNLKGKQMLKSLSLLFYTGRAIVRNELLDLGSLGTNQEEHFWDFTGIWLVATIDSVSSSKSQSRAPFWTSVRVIMVSTCGLPGGSNNQG